MDYSLEFYIVIKKQSQTFQLVVQILQQNPDDLNDWEDKRAERQGSCMIPTTRYKWLLSQVQQRVNWKKT